MTLICGIISITSIMDSLKMIISVKSMLEIKNVTVDIWKQRKLKTIVTCEQNIFIFVTFNWDPIYASKKIDELHPNEMFVFIQYKCVLWNIIHIYNTERTHPVRPSGIYSASLDCGKDLGHPTPAETLRRGQGRKYLFSCLPPTSEMECL